MIEEAVKFKVVGEIINFDADKQTYEIEYDDVGYRQTSVEFMENHDVLTAEPNDDFVFRRTEVFQCSECGSEPFYDSEADERYCPVCD